jgi:mono/diheme cytochrome c family protein
MGFRRAIIAIAAVWMVGVFASASAQAPKSVWDGAYTADQAKRGAESYMKHCSECHQAELSGDGFAPALAGADFMNAWNGLSVGDLYDRIRISMPPGKESAVSNAEKMDIVAHILAVNKFPAGQTELPPELEPTKQIKFEATKPGN